MTGERHLIGYTAETDVEVYGLTNRHTREGDTLMAPTDDQLVLSSVSDLG
jgi:hypothetical protein